ncbi:M24 family metallopeptidase [Gaetbulibacter saemankumensis]|uniref:M24 family metallopeptidase n=1 Tax=Gaetbulibacter saemankumensis TaxID=311208 RepID=UPI00040CB714|nr:Xaa-Pro peptidase family protein [Gaetbulibacter saemankumensis]
MNLYGIGGSSIQEELDKIVPTAHEAVAIKKSEFESRIKKVTELMKAQEVPAMYLHGGTNLYYFTGTKWGPSERMVGAILFSDGTIEYIAPTFEKGTLLDFMIIEGEVNCWEEHESPFELFVQVLQSKSVVKGHIFMDETTPFFITDGILSVSEAFQFINANSVISPCRMCKSEAEIAIIQKAMDITLEVHKAAARILHVGITAKEVEDFINEAHKRHGIVSGSYFCIVLFGKDTSFPHGVKNPKPLEANDVVLVDTGCMLHHYLSDITRTYVFGKPDTYQEKIWNVEKEAQIEVFKTAQNGTSCQMLDRAVREVLIKNGLGPDYKLPGTPHRTGHGIGLDIHEYPYILEGNNTELVKGMSFSNEPMICVPDKFGIRLEDHIYMTDNGPKWFTEPAHSIENPFGY